MDEELIEEMARAMSRLTLTTAPEWEECEHVQEGYRAYARACAPLAFKAGMEKAAEIAEQFDSKTGLYGPTGRDAKLAIAAAIRKAAQAGE